MFIKEKDEISSEKPDSSSMNRTLDSLAKIDNKLYFHVGVMDDSAHLIISAEGCPELMDTVASIVNLAPKLEDWGFIPVYDGLALFGQRNPELYPETVNGEVLYKRLQNGDCPWVSRPVDFDVVFPSENDAIQFSETINENGFEIEVSPYDGAEGWCVDGCWYFDYAVGGRYGLNTETANSNPTFTINKQAGVINFSNMTASNSVVL